MNKADKILIGILVLFAVIVSVPFLWENQQDQGGRIAVVRYRDDEVMRIDLSKDGTYQVKGTNGAVVIEVKDGEVAVVSEHSPYHLCSMQGFVSSSAEPIICLPNEIVVTIESIDDVDVVMQ